MDGGEGERNGEEGGQKGEGGEEKKYSDKRIESGGGKCEKRD